MWLIFRQKETRTTVLWKKSAIVVCRMMNGWHMKNNCKNTILRQRITSLGLKTFPLKH